MIFKNLVNWNYNSDKMEGLLYFAQRINELLFDFTLDTYRPHALNTPFLCVEALVLLKEIEKGTIDKKNLTHVLDELEWSLQHDSVAKELIEFDVKYYILNNDTDTIQKVKLRIELLNHAIRHDKYITKLQYQLKCSLIKKEKKKIDYLANSFVTTLVNLGYTSSYLNKLSSNYFYNNSITIDSIDCIDGYFDLFSLVENKYDIVFIADNMFAMIEDSCKLFDVELCSILPAEYAPFTKDKRYKLNENNVYLIVKNVNALEYFQARDIAERKLIKLRNLFTFFHHKKIITWNEPSIVRSTKDNIFHYVEKAINTIKIVNDNRPEIASKHLISFITNFSLKDDSFLKFDRVVDLHGIAISNNTPENQLLNVWTSLETLIPSQPNRNKITNIIGALIPLLMLNYTNSLIKRFASDLILWDRKKLWDIIKDIPQQKMNHKIVMLLIDDSMSDKREDIYTKFGDFVLLRNRMYNLHKDLSDPKKLQNMLDLHKMKIEWQLRRIYRTRNLIVHSATNPTYTNILIENAHDYLDQLLELIVNYSTNFESINTIEQGFELASLRYDEYLRRIKNCSKADLSKNISPIYFPNIKQ